MNKMNLIKSSYNSEQSNNLINITKRINENDSNPINNGRKRSFCDFNFSKNNKISSIKELFKKSIINETSIKRNITSFSEKKHIKNKNYNYNNCLVINKYKTKPEKNIEIFYKSKSRKNFILKSELYDELNEKQKKIMTQNLEEKDIDTNENKNNYKKFEIKQGNINLINNSNNINNQFSNNIISFYYKNNLNDNYSNKNIINNNSFKSGNDNLLENKNNLNYINCNINNIYFGYPMNSTNPYININNNNSKTYFQNQIHNQNNNFNIIHTNYEQLNYLAKNQIGCQILKNKIISDPKFANEVLFPNIINNLKEICTNIFGGSMILTLLEFLTYENIDFFLFSIKDQIKVICRTEPGSHVMQSLIRKIKDNFLLINKLIFYLNNTDLKEIFKSAYGHHFIKYYLSLVHKKEFTYFIFNNIKNNFIEIVTDKFGVCVIQKAFDEFDGEELDKLLKLTEENFNLLMKNCFGNYLIQFIFLNLKNKSKNNNTIFPFIKKMEENLLDFCTNKYSSAVLEKIFERGEEELKENLINYLLNFHSNKTIDILVNPNGFYVLKKGMYIKNKNIRKKIIKAIVDNKSKFEFKSKEGLLVNSFCKEFSEYF